MSQKLWRVVRSCVELGGENPLVQIHDQGAGGNCNVVKEIIYPLGGEIDVRAVKVRVAKLSRESCSEDAMLQFLCLRAMI
jgi:phosphoribosylformylglycinamidine synthase